MEKEFKQNDAKKVIENDFGTGSGFNRTVGADELLLDLKCLMKDYYVATFTESGDALKLRFNNGQAFILTIKACA